MSDADALFDRLLVAQAKKRLPPVARWQPERSGEIDIRIAADGTWYHEGTAIRRRELVDLFATILRRDPDGYWLVTPQEKLEITVDDAPFVAVDMEVRGAGRAAEILFSTNVGDHVLLDQAHPLRVEEGAAGPRPYLLVRDGLEALVGRAVYYRLAELAEPEADRYWLWSAGSRFALA